jgi:nucleotide-binding universal stress UspA family protein
LKKLKEVIDPEAEADKILNEAKTTLLQAQVPEELIKTKVMSGTPAEEILKEAEEDYNLIIMGRKGRTALKDLILGGVSSTVLHRCIQQTIALVSSP